MREELGYQTPASSQVTGKGKRSKGNTEAALWRTPALRTCCPRRRVRPEAEAPGLGCSWRTFGLGFPEAGPAQLLSFPGQTAPTSGPGDSASARGRDSERETGSSEPGGGARQRHARLRH